MPSEISPSESRRRISFDQILHLPTSFRLRFTPCLRIPSTNVQRHPRPSGEQETSTQLTIELSSLSCPSHSFLPRVARSQNPPVSSLSTKHAPLNIKPPGYKFRGTANTTLPAWGGIILCFNCSTTQLKSKL